jgi:mono/diheme cytochrome c family protein
MKNIFKSHGWVAAAFIALTAPAVILNAQGGGGRGGGGRAGAAPANVPAPTSPVTGNAVSGKGLFFGYGCYACHGYNGETGARPFVGRWGNLATEQTFLTFLRGRANVAPLTPSTSMPNFGEASLSDKQAKDIYAYIRTFKSSAPDLKDIPTLNSIVDAAKQDKK